MRAGPTRKKSLYLEGTRKNKHYTTWSTTQQNEFYEQILTPYDGTSSDEEEGCPKIDISEKSGNKLYVHKGTIRYGNKGPEKDERFLNVSELPIDHKVLAESGYTELTSLEKSFIKQLSTFIRTVKLSIVSGSFDCVTQLASKSKTAPMASINGDRPFPYYPSSKGNELFKLRMNLRLDKHDRSKDVKIVDFMGFSDGASSSSSTGQSATQRMTGEYIYLACDAQDSYDDDDCLTLHVSNSGKFTEDLGYGRDLCFTSEGFVTTLSFKAYNCIRCDQGEPLLIALDGSTMHTTYHQRQIIHRLLAEQNLSVDLEDFEGTEVQVLSQNDERLSRKVSSHLRKLSKAIRRGVISGRFKSTRELSDALFMHNEDLIVTLRHGMCCEDIKGATCFSSTVKPCEEAVIELVKGAYIEEGARWFRVHSGGVLIAVNRDVHWARLSKSGNVYHVEADTLLPMEVGDGDYDLLPYGKTLETGSYMGGRC